MNSPCRIKGPLLAGLVFFALFSAGCSDSGGGTTTGGSTVAQNHSNIVLRDQLGVPLTSNSTAPYSPRQTCGECHDIDEIANGYHFQQGRTDAHGNVQVKDDFNNDSRDWLKSDGMYGKW